MTENQTPYTATYTAASTLAPVSFVGSVEGASVEAIAELAREGSKPEILQIPTAGLGRGLPPTVPFLWDRHAQQVIPLVSHLLSARPPLERVGTAHVTTLASFVALVNRHKDEGSTIFAQTSWPGPKLTAVIDYHAAAGVARFGKHRVEYAFPVTREFTAWVNRDGKEMSQVEFASFIEEHAGELAAPYPGEESEYGALFKSRFAAPNELIDLSRELEVLEGATVKQGVRLESGERQIVFTTEHTTKDGQPVDIPGLFMVSVRPFVEGDRPVEPVRFVARIRYRIKGGGIVWFYQLFRWEDVMRDRIQQDLAPGRPRDRTPRLRGHT